jgi:uncharacterized protein
MQLVTAVYQAFGRGDIPTVLAMFDPNIEWRLAEGFRYKRQDKPLFGPDEIVEKLFMRLGSEWDGFMITPGRFHDAGDTIVVECRYGGTFKATGKSIDAQACHIWRARDGRLTQYQQYIDTAQIQEATTTGSPTLSVSGQ